MAFPTTILFDQINKSCTLLFALSQNINFCTHKLVKYLATSQNHRDYAHAYYSHAREAHHCIYCRVKELN